MMNKVPRTFEFLTIQQLEHIEERCISEGDLKIRFLLLKAAKGDNTSRREVMKFLKDNPSWVV